MKTPTQIREEVNQFIVDELERGVIPRHKSRECLQISGTTGKYYQSINQMILQIQKSEKQYKSNRWLTFKTITNLGGSVQKGEKGTMVVYWQLLKKDKTNEDGSTDEKIVPLLKYYYVFNLDQTTLESAKDKEIVKIATAEEIIDNFADKPEIRIGAQPCYIPSKDVIEIPTMDDFDTQDNYYNVLFHEITHSVGSSNRLGRKGVVEKTKFGDSDYALEELIGELGSAYLSSFANIESTKKQSASYIQGWLKALKNDKNLIFTASAEAWRSSVYVLNNKRNLLELFESEEVLSA